MQVYAIVYGSRVISVHPSQRAAEAANEQIVEYEVHNRSGYEPAMIAGAICSRKIMLLEQLTPLETKDGMYIQAKADGLLDSFRLPPWFAA